MTHRAVLQDEHVSWTTLEWNGIEWNRMESNRMTRVVTDGAMDGWICCLLFYMRIDANVFVFLDCHSYACCAVNFLFMFMFMLML